MLMYMNSVTSLRLDCHAWPTVATAGMPLPDPAPPLGTAGLTQSPPGVTETGWAAADAVALVDAAQGCGVLLGTPMQKSRYEGKHVVERHELEQQLLVMVDYVVFRRRRLPGRSQPKFRFLFQGSFITFK